MTDFQCFIFQIGGIVQLFFHVEGDILDKKPDISEVISLVILQFPRKLQITPLWSTENVDNRSDNKAWTNYERVYDWKEYDKEGKISEEKISEVIIGLKVTTLVDFLPNN